MWCIVPNRARFSRCACIALVSAKIVLQREEDDKRKIEETKLQALRRNQEMEEEVHLVFEEKNLFLKVDQMEVMVEKVEILF